MSIYVDIEKTLGSFRLRVKLQGGDEVLALLGASGCGKSLTLKCIAGVEKPDRGRIEVDGVTLFDSDRRVNLTPQERRTGLMFQNYALFPNMTVLENLRSGSLREKDKVKRAESVEQVMDMLGLRELADHYPSQLSGGQQQRTALARILVSAPRILLLDEPFSALDSHLRFHLEREMLHVLRGFGKTALIVSHDRDEVFRLADSVAVMDRGQVEVIGEKRRVFTRPETRAAAILTGCKNISPIEKLAPGRVRATGWGVELETAEDAGDADFVGIRMHDVGVGVGENSLDCAVVDEIENPFSVTVMLRARDGADSFGMELDKERWRQLRAQRLTVNIPRGSILLLKGDAR